MDPNSLMRYFWRRLCEDEDHYLKKYAEEIQEAQKVWFFRLRTIYTALIANCNLRTNKKVGNKNAILKLKRNFVFINQNRYSMFNNAF